MTKKEDIKKIFNTQKTIKVDPITVYFNEDGELIKTKPNYNKSICHDDIKPKKYISSEDLKYIAKKIKEEKENEIKYENAITQLNLSDDAASKKGDRSKYTDTSITLRKKKSIKQKKMCRCK